MSEQSAVDHGDLPDVNVGGAVATVTEEEVTEALKDVVDPEPRDQRRRSRPRLRSPPRRRAQCRHRHDAHLGRLPADRRDRDQTNAALEGMVGDVAINWVWMPPWGPDKITDDGRDKLRALGFNV